MTANETEAPRGHEPTDSTETERVVDGGSVLDLEEAGRELLSLQLEHEAGELSGTLHELSATLRSGEPLTERELQEVRHATEGLLVTLDVIGAAPDHDRVDAPPEDILGELPLCQEGRE